MKLILFKILFIILSFNLLYYFTSSVYISPICDNSICTKIITNDTWLFDGNDSKNTVNGGDIICIHPGPRKNLKIINVHGSIEKPIIIQTCGVGKSDSEAPLSARRVHLVSYAGYGLLFSESTNLRVTGSILPKNREIVDNKNNKKQLPFPTFENIKKTERLIKVECPKAGHCVHVGEGCSNIEIDHFEITNSKFAGIMIKRDPACSNDDKWTRGKFVMYNIWVHHNYIYNVTGEGMYIGNSFYQKYTCSSQGIKVYPHDIVGLKIWSNFVLNSGYDGIQIGCAVKGTEVWNNFIMNSGLKKISIHGNGLQIGGGAAGNYHNNFIYNSYANGIIWMGLGFTNIYNNIIVNSGFVNGVQGSKSADGIFADNRNNKKEDDPFETGTIKNSYLNIFMNTIVTSSRNGISLYTEVTKNRIVNNIIIDYKTGKSINLLGGVKLESKIGNVPLVESEKYLYNISSLFIKSNSIEKYQSYDPYYYQLKSPLHNGENLYLNKSTFIDIPQGYSHDFKWMKRKTDNDNKNLDSKWNSGAFLSIMEEKENQEKYGFNCNVPKITPDLECTPYYLPYPRATNQGVQDTYQKQSCQMKYSQKENICYSSSKSLFSSSQIIFFVFVLMAVFL